SARVQPRCAAAVPDAALRGGPSRTAASRTTRRTRGSPAITRKWVRRDRCRHGPGCRGSAYLVPVAQDSGSYAIRRRIKRLLNYTPARPASVAAHFLASEVIAVTS